jgi:C-3',4' desaturase CrtD
MDCEVVVVGAGIGGLTVAALLAQRGVNVCVLERESQVGGCAGTYEKFGYSFEPGNGLYTGWNADDIHARIFAQLPVAQPETRLLEPSYVVRLPDGSQISLTSNVTEFEQELARVFPECSEAAISFYRKLTSIGSVLKQVVDKSPSFPGSSPSRKAVSLATHGTTGIQILRYASDVTLKHLEGVSMRFRRFIDVQLQTLAQGDSSQVSYLFASLILTKAREGLFGIQGGAASLAERLAESIKLSGGRVRLNSPVLRLSYNSRGEATGVDLLSGESVQASRALISNLTVWDTYGKLVGLNRSPAPIRKQLSGLRGWGAYLVYAGMEEAAAETLPEHILSLTDWQEIADYEPEPAQLVIAIAPQWDPRAPASKRAVTIHAFTDVDQWFTFHRDETELEVADQRMLEAVWERLHKAVPELGSSIEVIDTVTPRAFYDQTRRKLGMVGGLPVSPSFFWDRGPAFLTSLPNLFMVSDTASPGGLAGVSKAGLVLANHLLE